VAIENCATPYLFISLSNIRENRQYKHSKNIAGAPALGIGGKKISVGIAHPGNTHPGLKTFHLRRDEKMGRDLARPCIA